MSDLVATFFQPHKKETNMRQLRLLIISIASICVLTLAAFALANRPPVNDPDDEIIIKGGSMEIQCGNNHGRRCLGSNDNMGRYKNQDISKHILRVVVMPLNTNDENMSFFNKNFNALNQPKIKLTYCE